MNDTNSRKIWTIMGLRVEGWIAILAFIVSLYSPIRDFISRPSLIAFPANKIELWYNGPSLKNWSVTVLFTVANKGITSGVLRESTIEMEHSSGQKWEFSTANIAERTAKSENSQYYYHIDVTGEIQSPIFLPPSTSKTIRYIYHTKRNVDQPLIEGCYLFKIYGYVGKARSKTLFFEASLSLSKEDFSKEATKSMQRRVKTLKAENC